MSEGEACDIHPGILHCGQGRRCIGRWPDSGNNSGATFLIAQAMACRARFASRLARRALSRACIITGPGVCGWFGVGHPSSIADPEAQAHAGPSFARRLADWQLRGKEVGQRSADLIVEGTTRSQPLRQLVDSS